MRTLLRLLIPLPAIIAIAASLLILEGDFLWKMQEQNLFLCTWLFFREQMVVPGGLLTWAGTFFTQFLYHPWMGVTMLAAWWMLLTWLLQRTFHLDGWRALLTVIPVLLDLYPEAARTFLPYHHRRHGSDGTAMGVEEKR